MERDHPYSFLFASAMFGGNTSLFESMKDILSRREDFESHWLLMEEHPHELITRIPPISWNWTLKGGFSMRKRILDLERQGLQFDAAFFNHLIPVIFLPKFRKRVPSIIALDVTPPLMDLYGQWYSVPTTSSTSPLEKMKYLLAHRAYTDAAYLMPFSEWAGRSLQHDYHMPEEKIRVMPAGINLARWKPKERAPSADRSVRVLFIGGDFIRKGGDMVLSLAAREEFSSCEFHILSYDSIRPMSSNVHVHSNIKPNTSDLMDLYQQSDVFVLPTRGDLSPIAILEAMAMELPVISTYVGGIPELIEDGATGVLIPPGDENAFAIRLKELVNNAALRLRLGRQARVVAQKYFSLEHTANRIVDHLKMIANNNTLKPLVTATATTLGLDVPLLVDL